VTEQLATAPKVNVGMLVRRRPDEVLEALADPSVTTRFWYTKSTGRMAEGAELTWAWDMYDVSARIWVEEVRPGELIRFRWDGYDPAHPTTVRFEFGPYPGGTTYLRITETGFTFLLSALKAALEHDITLRVTMDAHPPDLPG
jgi:uncharacterized protein YndB with AHSA1/START domain